MPAFFAATNPFVPYHTSAGQKKIVKFGGLLETEFLEPPPGRCFLFRQTYKKDLRGHVPDNLRKLIASPERPKGPPLHFHQYQTEYFKVEAGLMGIERDGKVDLVTKDDGEVSAKPGQIHQFFIHDDSPGDMTVLLSASDSGKDYQLDRIFFENWYGYWHDALLHDGGLNIFQFLSIQDGGDAYSVPPSWIPMPQWMRRSVGYWSSVIGGRWIGGLLGYKPFFKEYTTDWDFAVAKMKGSYFQRHLVEEAYKSGQSWDGQTHLSNVPKPLNAEYEMWTDHILKPENGQLSNGVNLKSETHKNGKLSNGVTSGNDIHKSENALKERKLAAF